MRIRSKIILCVLVSLLGEVMIYPMAKFLRGLNPIISNRFVIPLDPLAWHIAALRVGEIAVAASFFISAIVQALAEKTLCFRCSRLLYRSMQQFIFSMAFVILASSIFVAYRGQDWTMFDTIKILVVAIMPIFYLISVGTSGEANHRKSHRDEGNAEK